MEQIDVLSGQDIATDLETNARMLIEENAQMMSKIDFRQIADLVPFIKNAERIFIIGAGRTGLMMKAAAMRLMHLGYTVFVVGETVTPAIGPNDLLFAASGSGTTSTIVKAAEKALAAGAKILAVSTTSESPLAKISHLTCIIPAAQKEDHHGKISHQYAGSLFEQSVLLLTDAVIQTLWGEMKTPAEELWKRHANLE